MKFDNECNCVVDFSVLENAIVDNLENKYVFWDIDGTLAPYRFNDHVADPNGTNNGMSLKEIEDGVFLYRAFHTICSRKKIWCRGRT